MVEYAYGAVKNKQGKVGYLNFLMDITPDCDCESFSDSSIVRISESWLLLIVALDAASYHLVNQQIGLKDSLLEHYHQIGGDKFRGVWEEVNGRVQLEYAEEIGMGTTDFNLIEL